MLKRVRFFLVFIFVMIFFSSLIFLPNLYKFDNLDQNEFSNPNLSSDLDGVENIIVTYANRHVELSSYGVTTIQDILTFKNLNNNPINSILIGIPPSNSSHLVFFEGLGENENTLLTERSNLIMNGFEMVIVYFDSPLLPYQSKTIVFRQILKDLINTFIYQNEQYFNYHGYVFPILPYKLENEIISYYLFPTGNIEDISDDWGTYNPSLPARVYNFGDLSEIVEENYVEPFLANLNDNKNISIWVKHPESIKIEILENNREIFISPLGIIRIKEDILIHNSGILPAQYILLNLPNKARGLHVSDFLGDITGINVNPPFGSVDHQSVTIDLGINRAKILSNTSFRFSIEYYLPFDEYSSINWLQESIQFDLFSTNYDYLGKQQTVKIIIDGCFSIDSISDPPEAIIKSFGTTNLIYTYDYVSPGETKIIQFTFTIDIFSLFLRPFIFILLICLFASAYVILIKRRKIEEDVSILKKEFIPVNEIREFCSLFEEKNALILEIRQTEEDAKRKKIAKKKFSNILNKNNAKIDEIQKEITPFKKVILETSEIFENIIKRLDVLEAERISVKDSINLLEARYRKGQLSSRAAYLKLLDDFKKRTRKIDRTIDRYIQQLRSYLL